MSDTTNEFEFKAEDDLELLPDGWGEGDDIFDVDNWTGGSDTADASSEDTGATDTNAEDEAFAADDPTTADAESADDSAEGTEALPTTQPETKPAKLKFSATVDHVTSDVELDEADLPSIYQKAQVTDRVQAKLSKVTPIYEQAERTAKMLGYDTAEEMLAAAANNYRDAEVEKLVNEGTPKTIAEDYIDRKMKAQPEEEKAKTLEPGARDFESEARILLQVFPELKGQSIPDEVLNESIAKGEPLVATYRRYYDKQQKAVKDASEAEKKALKKANTILKQNAEAASRAPVRGVSGGGKTASAADDDPFLKGFLADGWD